MRRMLDEAIYYATLPLRLFGRSRRFRIGARRALASPPPSSPPRSGRSTAFLPADSGVETALAIMNPPPPLQAVTRSSYVIAPVAVALSAIRRKLDAAAPRELAGKNDNPVSSLLSKADIGITVARGAMRSAAQPNELTIIDAAQRHLARHRADRDAGRQYHRLDHRPARQLASARTSASSPARCSTSAPRCAAMWWCMPGRR